MAEVEWKGEKIICICPTASEEKRAPIPESNWWKEMLGNAEELMNQSMDLDDNERRELEEQCVAKSRVWNIESQGEPPPTLWWDPSSKENTKENQQ